MAICGSLALLLGERRGGLQAERRRGPRARRDEPVREEELVSAEEAVAHVQRQAARQLRQRGQAEPLALRVHRRLELSRTRRVVGHVQ